MSLLRRLFGNRGERAAGKYLRGKGMRILDRQFNTRWGEIDLICISDGCIVFIEVKTRRSDAHGKPGEAVDQRKQQHLTKAALAWLKKNRLLEHRARFDVVAIVWPEGSRTPVIEHSENAFPAADLGQMF